MEEPAHQRGQHDRQDPARLGRAGEVPALEAIGITVLATQIQTSSTATSVTVSRASPKLYVASCRMPPLPWL
jgi:hypothetical protein